MEGTSTSMLSYANPAVIVSRYKDTENGACLQQILKNVIVSRREGVAKF